MAEGEISERKASFLGAENNTLAATVFEPSDVGRLSGSPPVLLMHGGGQTRHAWEGSARKLAQLGFISVTVDARGHGDSVWVESQNYTFFDYRDDLRAITPQIRAASSDGTRAPVLIGASMGGISAMMAQSGAHGFSGGDLFSAIILVDITPRMESSGVDRIMGFMAENMRDGFASVEDAADAIALYLPNRKRPSNMSGLSKNLRQREDDRWYWHWDPAFVDGPRNILTDTESSLDRLSAAAAEISVPALLVRGSKSELVTKEAADEFLALVPHAKFVDVTDAGHMVAGDKNDVFAGAIVEFMQSDVLNA